MDGSLARPVCPRDFSQQESWSELPVPPPGDWPSHPGTESVSPASPALQADSLLLSHRGLFIMQGVLAKFIMPFESKVPLKLKVEQLIS